VISVSIRAVVTVPLPFLLSPPSLTGVNPPEGTTFQYEPPLLASALLRAIDTLLCDGVEPVLRGAPLGVTFYLAQYLNKIISIGVLTLTFITIMTLHKIDISHGNDIQSPITYMF